MHALSRLLARSHTLIQAILLTGAALVLLVRLYGINLNVGVMNIYYRGGTAFVQHQDPYAATLDSNPLNRRPDEQQFKYSPFFAVVMAEMVKFNQHLRANQVWTIGSVFLFCFGLSRWVNISGKLVSLLPFVLFAGISDLDVSMAVKQINALIVAIILIALAELRDGRPAIAGALLMLVTNFKVYPVIFLVAVGSVAGKRFWIGAFIMGLAVFLIPAAIVGWSHNFNVHLAWVNVVLHDGAGAGILDFYSCFERLGLASFGKVGRWILMIGSLAVFFAYLPWSRKKDFLPWFTFGMAGLLLLSPRTEVYTYVLLAPSYVFLVTWFDQEPDRLVRIAGRLLTTVIALAIASCAYTTNDWCASEQPVHTIRVVGAVAFWVISGLILTRQIVQSQRTNNTAVACSTAAI